MFLFAVTGCRSDRNTRSRLYRLHKMSQNSYREAKTEWSLCELELISQKKILGWIKKDSFAVNE